MNKALGLSAVNQFDWVSLTPQQSLSAVVTADH